MSLEAKPKLGKLGSIRADLSTVIIFVSVIWVVYALDLFLPLKEWFPLVPRTLFGLIGIFTSPFLHGDLWHILANTLPLVVLLSLLVGSRSKSWEVVILICLIGGGILWLFGNPVQFAMWVIGRDQQLRSHIGASLLIFGLITFLISSGFLEKRPIPMLIAFIVLFTYGFTLLFGIIPKPNSRESWDGHLSGAVAGVIVAYLQSQTAFAKVGKTGGDVPDAGL